MNHFTPYRIPYRRCSLMGYVITAVGVVALSVSLWFAVNMLADTWHAASSIGRPVEIEGR
ncbi:hypothetical protein LJR251_002728 [Rhizobium rhizogenes]|uniref:hypothetical protein n=1 Tax=Rhizobium rhizogenes TaxID=359 RepID=UPI003ECFA600